MFKKIGEAASKLTVKQLIVAIITSVIMLIIVASCYGSNIINKGVAFLLTFSFCCTIGVSSIRLAVTYAANQDEKERKEALEKLKTELSGKEFTRVLFKPANDNSKNIQRCLLVFEDFNVTHFAKISDDDNIVVIAKDANGKPSRPVTMDAARFARNYKVLK